MLSLLAHIYGKIANLRNHLYDRGAFESYDLGSRTISIGNLTTGGTGKTPLVAYVAGLLAERGEIVCILTRGYGRKDASKRILVSDGHHLLAALEESGDEPYELAQKLLGKAGVIADADRVAAAEWAKRKFGVTAFILDDGFQHRRSKRDVDIVCVDATDPFGGRQMLPAGRLREPIENLQRADAVVITRSDLVENLQDLKSEISDLRSEIPVFTAKNKIVGFTKMERMPAKELKTVIAESIKGKPMLAFCGLGNPENFYSLLRRDGLSLSGTRSFPDHHKYSQSDVTQMESAARASSASIFVTTAKDAVKLLDLQFEFPCYVVKIEVEIDEPEAFAAIL